MSDKISQPQSPHRRTRKVILLDIFNTLLRPTTPPAHQYAAVARSYDLPVTDDTASQTFKAAFKKMNTLHPNYGSRTGLEGGAQTWWEQIIKATLVEGLQVDKHCDTPEQALALYTERGIDKGLVQEILERFEGAQGYELFPDVIPFFDRLLSWQERSAEDLSVALASNSDERILLACKALGLDEHVNCTAALFRDTGPSIHTGPTVTSTADPSNSPASPQKANRRAEISYRAGYERPPAALSYSVGHAKPSASFFRSVLDLHGVSDDEQDTRVYYVGDDLEEDGLGAAQAGLGIRSIWLDRGGQGLVSQSANVTQVHSLLDVIGQLSPQIL